MVLQVHGRQNQICETGQIPGQLLTEAASGTACICLQSQQPRCQNNGWPGTTFKVNSCFAGEPLGQGFAEPSEAGIARCCIRQEDEQPYYRCLHPESRQAAVQLDRKSTGAEAEGHVWV